MPIDANDSVTSQRLQDDWFIVGGAAGAIATAGRAVLDYLLYRSGITDMQFPEIAGGAVLGKRDGARPRTHLERAIGYTADTILGSVFGSSLAYLIARTPTRHCELKGAMFGMGLWVTTLSIGSLLRIDGLSKPSARSMTSFFFTSTLYGISVGAIINALGKRATATQAVPVKVQMLKPSQDRQSGSAAAELWKSN